MVFSDTVCLTDILGGCAVIILIITRVAVVKVAKIVVVTATVTTVHFHVWGPQP